MRYFDIFSKEIIFPCALWFRRNIRVSKNIFSVFVYSLYVHIRICVCVCIYIYIWDIYLLISSNKIRNVKVYGMEIKVCFYRIFDVISSLFYPLLLSCWVECTAYSSYILITIHSIACTIFSILKEFPVPKLNI